MVFNYFFFFPCKGCAKWALFITGMAPIMVGEKKKKMKKGSVLFPRLRDALVDVVDSLENPQDVI